MLSLQDLELSLVHQVLVEQLMQPVSAEFAGVCTASSFVGDGSNLTGVVSGVELQFSEELSVGSAVTNINFSGVSSVTAPVAGLSTITVAGWEVRDTWLYGGG